MKDNMENVPSLVFNFLQSKPFEKLQENERQLVLRYFSAEEYMEMHDAISSLKTVKSHHHANAKERIKARLLKEFDMKYPQKSMMPLKSITYWLAAATLVLLFTVGYLLNTSANQQPIATAIDTDTVYIEKAVIADPLLIYDTVFIEKNRPVVKPQKAFSMPPVNLSEQTHLQENAVILGIDQLENTSNQPKNNSMKHDSLLLEFGFVTL